jgi:hypothetical protein
MALDLFAGIPVTDYAAALPWYERFFGGRPSFLPNDTEAVWEVAEHRYIYIVQDPGRAGNAMVLSFVDDLDDRVAKIARQGIEPAERETLDSGVTKVIYRDADGNEISFGGAATLLRSLREFHGDPETSHLLRPTAGHRDLSGPQPRLLLVGHIHDGEAAEKLLGLDERTVGEQRRPARRIDAEHRGGIVQATGEDEDPGSLHLCHQRPDNPGLLAQFLNRVVGHPRVIEGNEVLGHVSSFTEVAPAATLHPCIPA